ncbi:hypothetical protein Athai_60800 [Actinocatenispora thailandica]|uniref:Transmembrane protein n=1 Tax=Actinocatenispora thailandica TaxID=227318 RepID=A0A7R7DVF0_9ACTN|nr:hypothetical protein [Actinocatenispora thailandica]BCJ38577.1 hypothetical protein Athai_60800 [Actinocatenispora thailandica]
MARLRLIEYRWPRHARVATIVVTLVGAAALVVSAFLLATIDEHNGPMCGQFRMRPGDECYLGGSGSPASYSDVASAPGIPPFLFAGAVMLVVWLVLHVRRQNRPTAGEIRDFEKYVVRRRGELPEHHASSPDWQRRWPTLPQLQARFERRVQRERKRKGIRTAGPGA